MTTIVQSKPETNPGVIGRIGGVRRLAFYAVVLVGVVLPIVIFGPFLAVPIWGWFVPEMSGNVHFLHELGFFGVILVGVLGLAAQLYRPERRIAGLLQALIAFAMFLSVMLVIALAGDTAILTDVPFFTLVFGPAVLAALLHPAGRRLLRIRTAGRFSPLLAGLAVVAAIPLAFYAAGQYGLHWSGDEHAVINHYAGMIVYAGMLVALAVVASLKPIGWRIPLFSAAGLAVVLGLASILSPEMASSGGTMWGTGAIIWAVLFIGGGLLTGRTEEPSAIPREAKGKVA